MNPVELAASLLKSHDSAAVRAAAHAVILAGLDIELFRVPEPPAESVTPANIFGGGMFSMARVSEVAALKKPLREKYEKAVAELRATLAEVPA